MFRLGGGGEYICGRGWGCLMIESECCIWKECKGAECCLRCCPRHFPLRDVFSFLMRIQARPFIQDEKGDDASRCVSARVVFRRVREGKGKKIPPRTLALTPTRSSRGTVTSSLPLFPSFAAEEEESRREAENQTDYLVARWRGLRGEGGFFTSLLSFIHLCCWPLSPA